MKKIILTSALLLFILFQGYSQRFDYENTSKIFFGLNIGSVWHTSDVENAKDRFPLGAGFVFGGSINQNYGNAISFDVRFRYLGGTWYGKDSDTTSAIQNNYAVKPLYDTLGYTVQNFRAAQHRFALELSMHANRFKERTGFDPYIFGGIGFTASTTKGDLLHKTGGIDEFGIYPYNETPNGSIIDEKYETLLDINKDGDSYTPNAFDVKVLPSLGVGIGYYFNSRFSMGIEHKTTFVLDDYFDGTTVNQDGQASTLFKNDLYHYTSIYFKWYLRGRTKTWVDPEVNTENKPVTEEVRRDKPIVDFTNPPNSPHRTNSPSFNLKANIINVNSANDVSFYGNQSRSTEFIFNPATQKFQATVHLIPGLNTFFIEGKNQFGKARDLVEIYYDENIDRGDPPVVNITNPAVSPYTTNQLTYTVQADIRNVKAKNLVKVYFNDRAVTNFTFNLNGNNNFSIPLNLVAGTNILRIEGRNDFGTDTDELVIIYQREITNGSNNPPVVSILTPSADPYTTSQQNEIIVAKVDNIVSKQNIEVRLNGIQTTNFTFNTSSGDVQFTAGLNLGVNTIRISANNPYGNDFDETQIIYRRGVASTGTPPVVNILTPSTSPYTTAQPYENIIASINNVTQKQEVEVRVNGVLTNNFAFNRLQNSNVYQVQFNAVLNLGINTIKVSASNAFGNAFDETQIIYRQGGTSTGNPPVVEILTPSTSPYTTEQAFENVIATVDHVTQKQQVEVKINGAITNSFSFNSVSNSTKHQIQISNVALNPGTNTFRITANNPNGNDFDETQIIYRKVEVGNPPSVDIITPNVSPYITTQLSENIVANTNHVDTKQQIEVKINGVQTNNFTFNSSNGRVQLNAALNSGTNTIRISVNNTYGNDFDETQIISRKKEEPKPPVVEFIAPLLGQPAVNVPNYNMIAKVENVTQKSDIDVYFNSHLVNPSSYTFNALTKLVNYPSNLVFGVNTFKVSAKNNDGNAEASSKIERKKKVLSENNVDLETKPCKMPEINMTFPASNITAVGDNVIDILGQFENLGKTYQIEVFLNGRKVDGHIYNEVTKRFTHKVKFEDGKNTYVIRLTNDCGTIDQEFIFNKEPVPSCGVAIEMINRSTEFCLTTSTGTITSKDLIANSKYSYKGQASSLYFKASANGKATVNGKDYNLILGNYYHFVGILNVDISKNRPGANGKWSICVESMRPPLFGKGKSKPTNPCAVQTITKPEVKPRPKVEQNPDTRSKPNVREKPAVNKEGSEGDLEIKGAPPKTQERKTRTPVNTREGGR